MAKIIIDTKACTEMLTLLSELSRVRKGRCLDCYKLMLSPDVHHSPECRVGKIATYLQEAMER